jgi:hypothetical protein
MFLTVLDTSAPKSRSANRTIASTRQDLSAEQWMTDRPGDSSNATTMLLVLVRTAAAHTSIEEAVRTFQSRVIPSWILYVEDL